MPTMDGLTATRLIRRQLAADEKCGTLPIVAMTPLLLCLARHEKNRAQED